MKDENVELFFDEKSRQVVAEMGRYDLEELEKAILHRRLELATEQLQMRGLHTEANHVLPDGEKVDWRYALVYSPAFSADLPNAWADLAEVHHLLDFLANLSPLEAYRRWLPKVEGFGDPRPYTRADAVRDTREARAQLEADLRAGKINGREYADLYCSTSFMDLAK